ncbi:hypothetical protein D9757_000078 [Collybiopsis confluens]|uniref:ATP-dependent RNA helicase n=1 Tax=Collybiopsis confluens TaxID=2823264 RepID=A0A8H5MH89_9AGAR|nr:hypothetical protein D9757_000078 [Collybiopsis confluens]
MVKRKAPSCDDLLRQSEQPGFKKAHRRREPDDLLSDTSASPAQSVRSRIELDGQEDDDDSSDEDDRYSEAIPTLEVSERLNRAPYQPRNRPIAIHSAAKPPSASFSDIGISLAIQKTLKTMSIQTPTEIQAACIPPLLAGMSSSTLIVHPMKYSPGRDCIGNAKTGSGKTLAFALPIIQKLCVDPYGIFALVLTPTRYET